jgi:hypothetical protein
MIKDHSYSFALLAQASVALKRLPFCQVGAVRPMSALGSVIALLSLTQILSRWFLLPRIQMMEHYEP